MKVSRLIHRSFIWSVRASGLVWLLSKIL